MAPPFPDALCCLPAPSEPPKPCCPPLPEARPAVPSPLKVEPKPPPSPPEALTVPAVVTNVLVPPSLPAAVLTPPAPPPPITVTFTTGFAKVGTGHVASVAVIVADALNPAAERPSATASAKSSNATGASRTSPDGAGYGRFHGAPVSGITGSFPHPAIRDQHQHHPILACQSPGPTKHRQPTDAHPTRTDQAPQ